MHARTLLLKHSCGNGDDMPAMFKHKVLHFPLLEQHTSDQLSVLDVLADHLLTSAMYM